jgi:hypothetical protein
VRCVPPRVTSIARVLFSTLACAIVLCAPTASPAAARVPQGFVGAVIDGPLFPGPSNVAEVKQQLEAMVANGVQNIRVTFDWSFAQPYASFKQLPASLASQFVDVGGVPTRFSEMDEVVGLAAQRGLTILPTVFYAPDWDAVPHLSNTFAIPARDGPFANFVGALVRRYGPHGSFWRTNSPKVPLRMWQIWNEPNISTFWSLQPFQVPYIALVRAAHRAIKAADPSAEVVLAGMPNFSWRQLARIYQVKGARSAFDVVGVHPFTRTPQGVVAIIQRIRTVMDHAGDQKKPIIADEVSWPSSSGQTRQNAGLDFVTTRAGQASRIAKLLPLLGRDRVKLGLMSFDYYTWVGPEDHNGRPFDFSGLESFGANKFVAKPALGAFRRAALGLEGCRKKGDLATICLK